MLDLVLAAGSQPEHKGGLRDFSLSDLRKLLLNDALLAEELQLVFELQLLSGLGVAVLAALLEELDELGVEALFELGEAVVLPLLGLSEVVLALVADQVG